MGRPRADHTRDTREEILKSALRLYAERGFHATGMRALAAAVGLRESAIYHHFSSKKALLAALLEWQLADRKGAHDQEVRSLFSLIDRPLEEILTLLAAQTLEELQSSRSQQFARLVAGAGQELDDGGSQGVITDETRRLHGRLLGQLRKRGRIRAELDLDFFHAHFLAPLFFATGRLGGARPRAGASLSRFVRQHVAFMATAMAPPPRRR